MQYIKKLFIILLLLITSGCQKEEIIVDDVEPTLIIKEETIMTSDINYDYSTNFEASFGKDGGFIDYQPKELNQGENIIDVNAVGNNGKITKGSFIVNVSDTYQSSAIFFGDSIVAGYLTNGYSFANYINDNYDFSYCINAGISDYRLSTYDNPAKWLVDEVKNHYDDGEYDYIILQGGVNDVIYNTPIGEIGTYDSLTIIGGLETYLKTVSERWPNSKVGYIITYFTPNYSERGLMWSYDDYAECYDAIKTVLDNWNISYLDLFADEYSELLDVYNKTYLPDYLHLNKEGYELISPIIYEWMKTLQ